MAAPAPLRPDTDAARRLEVMRSVNTQYVRRISALEPESRQGAFATMVGDMPFGADVVEHGPSLQANMLLEAIGSRAREYAIDPRRIVVTSATDDLFEARVRVEPDGSALVLISHQVAALPAYLWMLGDFAARRAPGASRQVGPKVRPDEADDYCVAALRAALICLVVDGLSGKSRPTDPAAKMSRAEAVMVANVQAFVLAHEFSHALLGHPQDEPTDVHELEADRFALEVLVEFGRGGDHDRALRTLLATDRSSIER